MRSNSFGLGWDVSMWKTVTATNPGRRKDRTATGSPSAQLKSFSLPARFPMAARFQGYRESHQPDEQIAHFVRVNGQIFRYLEHRYPPLLQPAEHLLPGH